MPWLRFKSLGTATIAVALLLFTSMPLTSAASTPSEVSEPNLAAAGTTIDFVTVLTQVIEPACLKCHSTAAHTAGVVLETYKDVFKNLAHVQQDVSDGSMPLGGQLTGAQKQLILNWIAAGAPEKIGDPTTPVAPPAAPEIPAGGTADEREILNRGRYFFQASSCALCHTADPLKPLAGGRALPSPFGVFYSPNITQSKRYGIGNWSSSDFLRAVRSGIGPKHKLYYPVFPFTGYSKMTDSDINAVYAYLKTFKAVDIPNIKHRLHFPYSQRKLLEVWRAAYFRKEEGEPSLKRIRMGQGAFVPLPSHDADWNRGAYLVEGPLHCAVCHTPRDVLGGPKLQLWMAGSTTSGDPKRAAPDITPTLHTSVGNWSASDWIVFLNTAQMPNGSFVGGEMKDVIRGATSVLTDDDKLAVARYLHSLEPVENEKLAETIRAQKDARSEGK